MQDPIAAAKSALSFRYLFMALVAFIALGIIFGALGLWQWLINPWGQLKAKFPALAKFELGQTG